MSARRDDHHRVRRHAAPLALLALLLAACGLPGDGSVRTVPDEDVPYRLLAPASPAGSPDGGADPADRSPAVFWVMGDHLLPEVTTETCSEDEETLVRRLLSTLSAGPGDDARAAGRSSALPADLGLDVVGVGDGTAEVGIEPGASIGADQLPIAVGQVVLTLTSAPTISSVVLVSDGARVQVPLLDGVLTEEPVTAADYAGLLPDRFGGPGAIGCR